MQEFLSQSWIWLYLAASLPIALKFESRGSKVDNTSLISSLCAISTILLPLLALFFAPKWWFAIIVYVAALCLSSGLAAVVTSIKNISEEKGKEGFGIFIYAGFVILGQYLSPILMLLAYIALFTPKGL